MDIIGKEVELEKSKVRAESYFGNCPFCRHMVVDKKKQLFHCFGCDVGGNVFNFVMKFYDLSFEDAVKKLAK